MSRPKKVILLVGANEQELSTQRFMLETRGYRVLAAQDAAAAMAQHGVGVDLVLGLGQGMLRLWAKLAVQMKAADSGTPILLLARLKPELLSGLAPAAEAVLDGRTSAAELLERVRVLIQRKRGPRKLVLAPVVGGGIECRSISRRTRSARASGARSVGRPRCIVWMIAGAGRAWCVWRSCLKESVSLRRSSKRLCLTTRWCGIGAGTEGMSESRKGRW